MSILISYRDVVGGSKKSNQPFAIEVKVENKTSEDIVIEITKLSGEFTLDSPLDIVEYISTMQAKTLLVFLMAIHTDIESKKIQGRLFANVKSSTSNIAEEITLDIEEEILPLDFSGYFELTKFSVTPKVIVLGQSATLEITIRNKGNCKLKDIKLGFTHLPKTQGNTLFNLKTLDIGKSYLHSVEITPLVRGEFEYVLDGSHITAKVQNKLVCGSNLKHAYLLVK